MTEATTPAIGDRVIYRVRQNPATAPDRDYVRDAMVMDIGEDGVTLVVFPKRADPFQIGPIPHVEEASEQDIAVWQEDAG